MSSSSGRIGRGRDASIRADFWNGESYDYGLPDAEPMKKLREAVAAVRSGRLPACGLESTLGQTLCLNGAQDTMPGIVEYQEDMLTIRGEPGSGSSSSTACCAPTEAYRASHLMDLPWSWRESSIPQGAGFSAAPSPSDAVSGRLDCI
jgi:hypothetical protein